MKGWEGPGLEVLGPFGGSARPCRMSHHDASTLRASQETCSLPLVMSTSRPSRMNSSTWSSSLRPTSGECPACPAFSGMALPLFSLFSVGPERLGLDEGQLGEKTGYPPASLLLVTLLWGLGAFCRYQPSFHGVDLSALRGAAVDEYFRQPVVVSGAPKVLSQLALGMALLGGSEGAGPVRPCASCSPRDHFLSELSLLPRTEFSYRCVGNKVAMHIEHLAHSKHAVHVNSY